MTAGGGAGGTRPPSRRSLVLRVVALLALALSAFVLMGERRRAEHDPKFCASSCHREPDPRVRGASADWHAPGHGKIACQECHAISTATGLRLVWEAYTRPERVVAHGKATSSGCSSCHEKRPADWRLIAETAGHREHRDVKGVDCLSCHASSAHVAEAPDKACLGCHQGGRLHKPETAGAETCLSCHNYAASARNARQPPTLACERCHGSSADLAASGGGATGRPMKEVNEHALHGGVACQLCHNAHKIKPAAPAGQPVCSRCHQFENFQVEGEQRTGPEEHRRCVGCHEAHAPAGSAAVNCVTCHAKNAKGLLADGEAAKTTALKHASCASCHLPHTWKAERSGCMQCHREQTQLFQARSPPQHKACTDCHEVHGTPPTGAVCLKCHSDTKGRHVALAPERHKDCTSCHDPHAPKPEDARTACSKCHAGEVTQLARDGPEGHAKDGCFGCHKPHENPLPPADVCSKCHGERAKVVQTAGPPKHRVCTSCHQSHGFRITEVPATCNGCHGHLFDAVARGVAAIPHAAECKSCHTFHGEPGVARGSCLECHATVAAEFRPPNEKHAACDSCHQPHSPASLAPAQCRSCHADKAAVAAQWPPGSAHAQQCNRCHQPHDVRAEKPCAECHAAEAASATGARHQCQQCHPPHGAPPGPGAAWWQRCNACHAAKVKSVKELGPTHSDCKSCHQQHRFAVPTCTTCHKDMDGKGLHAVQQHAADCTKCHDPHVRAAPTRDKCLACHTNRQNHEPGAKQCNTCHIFK
jgi:hypothetical protein